MEVLELWCVQGVAGGVAASACAGDCALGCYVCACVHVCICECMHVCMCACVHVCMCACVHVCMCACVHMRTFVSAPVCGPAPQPSLSCAKPSGPARRVTSARQRRAAGYVTQPRRIRAHLVPRTTVRPTCGTGHAVLNSMRLLFRLYCTRVARSDNAFPGPDRAAPRRCLPPQPAPLPSHAMPRRCFAPSVDTGLPATY
jgi:hypothetical protein